MEKATLQTRIAVSLNFFLDEFVDPHTYFNTPDNGLSLLDKKLFLAAELLREKSGKPLSINTWWRYYAANFDKRTTTQIIAHIEASSTLRKWSGYRSARSKVGGKLSAHRRGQAIDPKGNGKALFKIVEDNACAFYAIGIRRLEDANITPTWLHLDTWERKTQPNSIRVVDLTKMTKTIRW
jgi:hypothetical protein